MQYLSQALLVAVGSALGGLARWLATIAAGRLLGTAFPWGTLLINVSGCFLLGWLITFLADRVAISERSLLSAGDFRLLIGVGFSGAFTTFSTFELETHHLAGTGHFLAATLYVALSVGLGLAAVRLGILTALTF